MFVILHGCTKPNPAAICPTGVCQDPGLYCDVNGAVGGEPGRCLRIDCSPGEFTACDGDVALACSSDGHSFETTDCGAGCDPAAGCRPFCTAGASVQCTNNELTRCNAAGQRSKSKPVRSGVRVLRRDVLRFSHRMAWKHHSRRRLQNQTSHSLRARGSTQPWGWCKTRMEHLSMSLRRGWIRREDLLSSFFTDDECRPRMSPSPGRVHSPWLAMNRSRCEGGCLPVPKERTPGQAPCHRPLATVRTPRNSIACVRQTRVRSEPVAAGTHKQEGGEEQLCRTAAPHSRRSVPSAVAARADVSLGWVARTWSQPAVVAAVRFSLSHLEGSSSQSRV